MRTAAMEAMLPNLSLEKTQGCPSMVKIA